MARHDVIIVGAGSAGVVLACRLSEDPERRVLLLDAGPHYRDFEEAPEDVRRLTTTWSSESGPEAWGFTATANSWQAEPMPVPRGRLVGGTSAINGAVFLRGLPADFEQWTRMGVAGWSFGDMLPAFRRIETDLDIHDEFHGASGPIPVRRPRLDQLTAIHGAFHDACHDVGVPWTDDMNHPESRGFGLLPMNHLDGERMSTARTYLAEAVGRPNLTVRGEAHIFRVRLAGGTAVGVEGIVDGARFTADGDLVVLSAGAIGSPHVLLNSGIGEAEDLRKVGLDTVHHLPGVGRNLRDHPAVMMLHHVNRPGMLDIDGPLVQVGVRVTSGVTEFPNDVNFFACATASSRGRAVRPDTASFTGGLADAGADPMVTGVAVMIAKADGEGRLSLRSLDPAANPKIDYNYLTQPSDLARFRFGLRTAAAIVAAEPYARHVEAMVAPGQSILADDGGLDQWVRERATTGHHIAGTCRMGAEDDVFAVVDDRLRVHGIENLAVVDASIMPDVVAANTNASVIAIAERAATML